MARSAKGKTAQENSVAANIIVPPPQETPIRFRPLADRVLIRPDTLEERVSPGGIVLPDNVRQERYALGTVVAVGPGKPSTSGDPLSLTPVAVKAGDRVVFARFADPIQVDGEEYMLLREDDIYGVYE